MKIGVTLQMPESLRTDRVLMDRVHAGIRAALPLVGAKAVEHVVVAADRTKPRPPRDTGGMLQRMGYQVHQDGRGVTVGPSPVDMAKAAAMEKGRRPGSRRPPRAPLLAWIRRRGLVGGFTARGRRRRLKGGDAQERALAAVLQRSIARKGIRARGFFLRAAPLVKRDARLLLEDGINRAIVGGRP